MEVIVPADEEEDARAGTSARVTTFTPASLRELIDPVRALGEVVVDRLQALGLERAHIGCELAAQMQPASYLSMNLHHGALRTLWQKELPCIVASGADALLATASARKTGDELGKLRLGCEIAGLAYRSSVNAIYPGATEQTVAGAILQEYRNALQGKPVRREEAYFFCMSGPNASHADAAYARTRHRTIESGDVVMVHCNSATDGMWSDITRTFVVGEESTAYKKVKAAVTSATHAALEVIRPGALGKEVDRAAREVMEQAGYGGNFTHATGHGVGFAAANPNGLPRIHPCSEDRLEEGMTFNIEPAAYFKNEWGYRRCDVVAVTADGAEVLTPF
jgi:Xaa-Pro aminopeptidase